MSKQAILGRVTQDAVKNIDVMDPMSDLNRFEEKVRREEAMALGKQQLAGSSLDARFESLDDPGNASETETGLAALKQGRAA